MTVINAITRQPFPVERPKPAQDRLRDLVKQGLSARQIADRLNLGAGEVRKTAHRYRIKITPNEYSRPTVYRPISDKRLRRMVSQGLTLKEMSRLLGRSTGTISKKMKELNISLVHLGASLVIEMPVGLSRAVLDRAVLTLQRGGDVVYPAALFGGPQGRWCINSRENEMDAERLVAKASKLDEWGRRKGVAHG